MTFPYSIGDLRRDNPQTSFPKSLSNELLASYSVYPVAEPAPPAYDSRTQLARRNDLPTFSGGVWVLGFTVINKTPEEVAAFDAEQAEGLKNSISEQTQARLDDFARTRNYDGMLSLCTYATSTNPTFAAEGQYGVEARDATWAKLYEMLAEVGAGTRPVPSGFADIEPELPELIWPIKP